MGAYLSKPITKKVSESGEYCTRKRKIIYGATAMQGWRVAMEDAHCVVPEFDEGSSLFSVFDGHGGKEVAVYCATHLADMIKSTAAYREAGLPQAMKDAFMQCDRLLKEKEAINEMKKYDEDEIPAEEQDHYSKEDLENLLEESSMPLRDLLVRYNAPRLLEAEDEDKSGHLKREGISSILQLLTNTHDSDSEDSDSGQESVNSSDESGSSADSETTESCPTSSKSTSTQAASPQVSPSDKTSLNNSQPSHCKVDVSGPLQSIHEAPPGENTNKEVLELPSTPEKPIDVSQNISGLESRSLMDLLTAKPDKPDVEFESPKMSRKRPHPSAEENASSNAKKGPSGDKQGYHSGTTAVVGILRDGDFTVANAGDSKCVLASRGKAIDMSFDHKPTDKTELERIIRAGGHVGADSRVNGGLNLSRALGDHFYKKTSGLSLENQMISAMPDIKSVPIGDDQDFIVFACDGIWNSKTSQEVVDFVCYRLVGNEVPTQQHLTQICESLCDACLAADTDNDGTGCDNMTCILIYLKAQ